MPAKKTGRGRAAASAARMAGRRRRLAESAWWGDDFGEWFDDFALDPFRMAPGDGTVHLRNARTEFLKALRSVLTRWIDRSEHPPRGRPATKKSKSSSKKSPKKSRKSPSRTGARRGAQRVRVS
jgi:hypothetical protein